MSDRKDWEDSLIEVSIGMDSGTTAECECGWRVNMPPGVMPQIVTDHVQAHEAKTGHHWPTESEASVPPQRHMPRPVQTLLTA